MTIRTINLLSILLYLIISACSIRTIFKVEESPDSTLNNTCTVSGYIFDQETKEPLISANISLNDEEYIAYTDIEGFFLMENISSGIYYVNVSYGGFKNFTKTNVEFKGNHIYKLNIEMLYD